MSHRPFGAGADLSVHDGEEEGSTHRSAEEEVLFLRNKIKYLQSVTTVFRQKVSLALRDVKRDPQGKMADFEKNYNSAINEITSAELSDFYADRHGEGRPSGSIPAVLGGGFAASLSASKNVDNKPDLSTVSPFAIEVLRYQRARASKDDIRKTHHLCTILQEKNDIKGKEVALRKKLDTVQRSYGELEERFTKFVELQASGAGPAAAQQELWEKREQSMQRELVVLKTELARAKTVETQTVVYEDAVIGDATLVKQNQLLKARLQRAKEDAAAVVKRGTESTQDLQGSLDSLIEQIHALRSQLEEKDLEIRTMTKQRHDLTKDLVTTRSQLEHHSVRAEALEKQQQDKEAVLAGVSGRGGSVALTGANGGGESVFGRDLDVAQKRIRSLEHEVEHLTERVATEININREKEIKLEGLGTQIQNLRKKMEAQTAGKEARGSQQFAMEELENRLGSALKEMQSSQLTVQMTQQMSTITEKLKQLEHVELQLRQKEDQLAIAQDEAKTYQKSMENMKVALRSISTMYMKFPQSASQLERMVVELEEFKAEVQRCASERDIPDTVRLGGVIDLRCMDAQSAKPVPTMQAGQSGVEDGVESIFLDQKTASILGGVDRDTHTLDDSDLLVGSPSGGYDTSLFQELPPPPSLLSTTAFGSFSPHKASSVPGGTALPEIPPGIGDGDARLTFQLFDEKSEGKLPVETVRLCLTTLGLPTKLIPPHTRAMTLAEFVALCSTSV